MCGELRSRRFFFGCACPAGRASCAEAAIPWLFLIAVAAHPLCVGDDGVLMALDSEEQFAE
jgi:hypothetical protein